MDNNQDTLKSAIEIGQMASMLNAKNQSYVLNTINALLYSQQVNKEQSIASNDGKSA